MNRMSPIVCFDALINFHRNIESLTPAESDLVVATWIAAEKAMQGRSVLSCALFKRKQGTMKVKSSLFNPPIPEPFNKSFTREELQLLKARLSHVLSKLEEEKRCLKLANEELWEQAIPDDNHGETAFHVMNNLRDELRRVKKESSKLSAIQVKIKRMLSKY